MKNFFRALIGLVSWMFFMFLVMMLIAALSGCNRRPRADRFEEAPNLPADTVQVIRFIDMCNYKYISGDTIKAKKQLEKSVKAIDKLIIHYDSIIKARQRTVRAQQAIIKTHPG